MQGTVSPAVREPSGNYQHNDTGLQLGQRVYHEKFGEGVVMNYEGDGRHARVQINFMDAGSKWLVMEYANLMVC